MKRIETILYLAFAMKAESNASGIGLKPGHMAKCRPFTTPNVALP